MPVYPSTAANASCLSQGCACHARTPRYPSDLSDAQWAVLEPEARAAMAELVRASGRPMVHDLRVMLDAVAYVTRYGIEWRALPVDFPPHEAVYAFFQRWSGRGLPQRLVDGLRARILPGSSSLSGSSLLPCSAARVCSVPSATVASRGSIIQLASSESRPNSVMNHGAPAASTTRPG